MEENSMPGFKVGDRIHHHMNAEMTGTIVRFYRHEEKRGPWTLAEIRWDEGVNAGPTTPENGSAYFQMVKIQPESDVEAMIEKLRSHATVIPWLRDAADMLERSTR